jgi:dihydrofolate reductase
MGRKTHESIGRTLRGRTNIVISSEGSYEPKEGSSLCHGLEEAFSLAKVSDGPDEIFVIGGAQVYAEALSFVDRVYATEIDELYSGDTYFPKFLEGSELTWEEVSREERRDEGPSHDYVIYERVNWSVL